MLTFNYSLFIYFYYLFYYLISFYVNIMLSFYYFYFYLLFVLLFIFILCYYYVITHFTPTSYCWKNKYTEPPISNVYENN